MDMRSRLTSPQGPGTSQYRKVPRGPQGSLAAAESHGQTRTLPKAKVFAADFRLTKLRFRLSPVGPSAPRSRSRACTNPPSE